MTIFGREFLFDFGGVVSKLAHFAFVLGVEIPVVFRYGDVDFAVRFDIDAVKFWGFIVAFCAPAYVVGVAKGVHIEDVDVSWGKGEVLEELCCSVRWKWDLVVRGIREKILTLVNKCNGSKNKNEMTNHRTYVEARETIRVKKSWL